MLSMTDVDAYYGPIRALHGVTLSVAEGEIVTLIGANGAGKSTILRVISGLLRPAAGEVLLDGAPVSVMAPERLVAAGVCHVPEGRRVFAGMTVLENLQMGAYLRKGKDVRASMGEVFALFPRLDERRSQLAGTLSGGEQQMLAIGRALMSRPRLLMLDEPSLGLAPNLVRSIFGVIQEINRRGVGVLLVEQNAHMALGVARRGYVLETGRVILSAPVAELAGSPEVRAAYLGD